MAHQEGINPWGSGASRLPWVTEPVRREGGGPVTPLGDVGRPLLPRETVAQPLSPAHLGPVTEWQVLCLSYPCWSRASGSGGGGGGAELRVVNCCLLGTCHKQRLGLGSWRGRGGWGGAVPGLTRGRPGYLSAERWRVRDRGRAGKSPPPLGCSEPCCSACDGLEWAGEMHLGPFPGSLEHLGRISFGSQKVWFLL